MDIFIFFSCVPCSYEYVLGKFFLFFIEKIHYDIQVPIFFLHDLAGWALVFFIVYKIFCLSRGDVVSFFFDFPCLIFLLLGIFFDDVKELVFEHQSHEAEKFFSH